MQTRIDAVGIRITGDVGRILGTKQSLPKVAVASKFMKETIIKINM